MMQQVFKSAERTRFAADQTIRSSPPIYDLVAQGNRSTSLQRCKLTLCDFGLRHGFQAPLQNLNLLEAPAGDLRIIDVLIVDSAMKLGPSPTKRLERKQVFQMHLLVVRLHD
jgi:hypothetical protein